MRVLVSDLRSIVQAIFSDHDVTNCVAEITIGSVLGKIRN